MILFGYDMALSSYDRAGKHINNQDWYLAIEELSNAINYMHTDYTYISNYSDFIANCYDFRAACYEEIGEYDNAIKDETQAITLCPNDIPYYNSRLNLYIKNGEYNKAILDIKMVLKLDPNNIKAYCNLATCNRIMENLQDAIDNYTKAIELCKHDYETLTHLYSGRGECYAKKHKPQNAIDDYTKAIELCNDNDPEIVLMYRNRALCYEAIGEYERAKEDCEYIIGNKSSYFKFCNIDEESVDVIAEIYERLQDSDCDNVNENEEYDISESGMYLQNAIDSICIEHDNSKAFLEFYKAYNLDSKYTTDMVDAAINNLSSDRINNILAIFLESCEAISSLEISEQEKLQFAKQLSEKMKQNSDITMDISQLHYNPKQGRKLDL